MHCGVRPMTFPKKGLVVSLLLVSFTLAWVPAASAESPPPADLVPLSLTTSDTRIVMHEPITLRLVLQNQGASLAHECSVRLFVDGEEFYGAGGGCPLDRQESRGLDLIWTPMSAGEHELEVFVDSAYQVEESNESNNRIKVRFTAHTPAPVRSYMQALDVERREVDGETVDRLWAIVMSHADHIPRHFHATFYENGTIIGTAEVHNGPYTLSSRYDAQNDTHEVGHFLEMFHRHTGTGPTDYMAIVRIDADLDWGTTHNVFPARDPTGSGDAEAEPGPAAERGPTATDDPPEGYEANAPELADGEDALSALMALLQAKAGGAAVVGVAAGSIGLVGAVLVGAAWLRESSRFAMLKALAGIGGAVGLFSRIQNDKVLDHKVREEIHRVVGERPGISYRELRRALGIGNGTLAHHLQTLERAALVRTVRDGNLVRFYHVAATIRVGGKVTPSQSRLIEELRIRPGITAGELAARLGVSRQAVHQQLTQLRDAGLVGMTTIGKVHSFHLAAATDGRLIHCAGCDTTYDRGTSHAVAIACPSCGTGDMSAPFAAAITT